MAEGRRLFFALWPDAGLQRSIAAAAGGAAKTANLEGRSVRIEGLHMTLLFLGEVATEREPALLEVAARVQFARFSLKLDVLGSFARARILWIGCREAPAALGDLARQLRERVACAGFEFDRKPLVPHVTVMRDIDRSPLPVAIPPLAWNVAGFALVHSAPGSRYHVVSHWHMQNGPPDIY